MSDDPVLIALRGLAQRAGLDLQTQLYNAALDNANREDLVAARDLLLVLTGLFPSDGDAHLLLARVLSVRGLWAEAMAELVRADACGAEIPERLLNTVGSLAPEGLESFHRARRILAENKAARAFLTPKPRAKLRLVPTPADDDDAPSLVEPEEAPPTVAAPDFAATAARMSDLAAAELDQPRRTQSPRTRESSSVSPLLVGFAVTIGLFVLSIALFALRH